MRLSNRNPFLSFNDGRVFSSYGKAALIWLKEEDKKILRNQLGPKWKSRIHSWAGSCTACGSKTNECVDFSENTIVCKTKNCNRFKDTRVKHVN